MDMRIISNPKLIFHSETMRITDVNSEDKTKTSDCTMKSAKVTLIVEGQTFDLTEAIKKHYGVSEISKQFYAEYFIRDIKDNKIIIETNERDTAYLVVGGQRFS